MSIFSWFGQSKSAAVAAEYYEAPSVPSPEMSPDAAALDLRWDTRGPDYEMRPDAGDAELMRGEELLASVSLWRHPSRAAAWSATVDTFGLDRGDLQSEYRTIDEAMAATEGWAVERGLKLLEQQKQVDALNQPMAFFQRPSVEQLAEASEGFHARAVGELEPSQARDTTSFLVAHPPVIEEFAEASESYHRGLFAGREGRGAEMEAGDSLGRNTPGLEL